MPLWRAVALAPMLWAASAQAQTSVPPSVSLPTREELQREAPSAPASAPRLRIHGEIEAAPCSLDNPAYAAIHVTITKALFAHLGPVRAEGLAQTYAQYLGKDQPISVVCKIRDAAATHLRALGYIASVEVPVQRIANGEVRFEVLYARVTAVHVVGQVGPSAPLFEAYLKGLAKDSVFNRFAAERQVLLARDVPGYEVQLTLKPAGTAPGDMIAEVRLARAPVEVDVSLSNLAAPATGRFGAQGQVRLHDLLGLGDRTTLGVYTTTTLRKQQIYQLGEEIRLGASGLKLAGRVTYALTRPELGAGLPVIHASTFYANAELSYPLRLRTGQALGATLGMDLVDQNVNFDANGADSVLSRDRARIAYARLDFSEVDLTGGGPKGSIGWRVSGDVEVRHGLAVLGSTPNCVAELTRCTAPGFAPPSVPRSDPETTVLRGHAGGEWHGLGALILGLDARGQWASGSAVAFEEMVLGNFSVGRGYAPGALAGDSGVAFQAEAKLVPMRLNSRSAITLAPYVFSDNGWLWTRGSGQPGPSQLHSLGAGLRADLHGIARLDASVAAPLTALPGVAHSRDPLLLLTLSTSLQPWRKP